MAIAALILGALALLSSWTLIGGILLGLAAVVLGFIASGRAKRGQGSGRGMAITGIILGLLGLAAAIALIVGAVTFLNSDTGQELQDCLDRAGSDQAAIDSCERRFEDDIMDRFTS
jgi:hypothetical protein